MRVLALTCGLDESHGWGRYGAELLRALQALGVETQTLAERSSVLTASDLSVERVLRRSGSNAPLDIRAAADAPRFASLARRFDVIHALDETKLGLGVALAWLSGRPLAATLHGTYAVRALERRGRLNRILFKRVDGPIFDGEYTRKRVSALAPELAARSSVVLLGVRAATAEAPSPSAAAREPLFLSVGAVKRRKGVLEGLRAVAAARRVAPGVRFVVAGAFSNDDPYVQAVRGAARDLDAEDVLVLLGKVSEAELGRLYASARGLLMPSQNTEEGFEGFGLVHLEAAQRGLPTIGSLDCGNEDAVRDGVTGLLTPQGDAGALEAAVARLLGDDDGWDAMSAAGRTFAREMNWARAADRTRAVYREIAALRAR